MPTGPDVLPSLDSVEFASQIELLMIAAADEARSLQAETEQIGRDARDLGGQDDVVSATLDKDFTKRVRSGTLGRGNEARSSGNHVCRSEERRVGKGGVSTCSSRWAPDQ